MPSFHTIAQLYLLTSTHISCNLGLFINVQITCPCFLETTLLETPQNPVMHDFTPFLNINETDNLKYQYTNSATLKSGGGGQSVRICHDYHL